MGYDAWKLDAEAWFDRIDGADAREDADVPRRYELRLHYDRCANVTRARLVCIDPSSGQECVVSEGAAHGDDDAEAVAALRAERKRMREYAAEYARRGAR